MCQNATSFTRGGSARWIYADETTKFGLEWFGGREKHGGCRFEERVHRSRHVLSPSQKKESERNGLFAIHKEGSKGIQEDQFDTKIHGLQLLIDMYIETGVVVALLWSRKLLFPLD
jgi:hypothetical protein